MSLVARTPIFGFSDQVQNKPGCTATEDEIFDLERRGMALFHDVAKTKVPGYRAADLRLCFRNMQKQFSHDAAHMLQRFFMFIKFTSSIINLHTMYLHANFNNKYL